MDVLSTFVSLPVEMHDYVADFLDLHQVGQLRLGCRALRNSCDLEYLIKRLESHNSEDITCDKLLIDLKVLKLHLWILRRDLPGQIAEVIHQALVKADSMDHTVSPLI